MKTKKHHFSNPYKRIALLSFIFLCVVWIGQGQKTKNTTREVLGSYIAQEGSGGTTGSGSTGKTITESPSRPTDAPPFVAPTSILPTSADLVPTSPPPVSPPPGVEIVPGNPVYVPTTEGTVIDLTTQTVSVRLENENSAVSATAEIYPTNPLGTNEDIATIPSSRTTNTSPGTSGGTTETASPGSFQPVGGASGTTTKAKNLLPPLQVIGLDKKAADIAAYWMWLYQVTIRPLGEKSFTIEHKKIVAKIDMPLLINFPRSELVALGPVGRAPIAYYPDRALAMAISTRAISSPVGLIQLTQNPTGELMYKVEGSSRQHFLAAIPIPIHCTVEVSAQTLTAGKCKTTSPFWKVIDLLSI